MRQFKEALIEEMRSHSSLYNNARKTFKDTKMKANAWMSVAKALSRFSGSADEEDEQFRTLCMRTWKGLRERFMRELREGKKRSGDKGERKRPWEFINQLEFIRPYVCTRSTKGNLLASKKLKNAGSGLTSQQTQQNQQTQLVSVGRVAESDADDADVCSLPVPGSPFSPSCSGSRKRGKADHRFFEDYIRNDKESTDRFAQTPVASTSSGSDASLDEVDLQVRVLAEDPAKYDKPGYMLDESEAEMATSAQETL
ncbi:hypothetical protein RvY_17249 [Ramazzottius varieornatus]|uniref:MADF domain-containing protein n=1 Tax=Ramazzottius varieornatus TaxID=947166 RepID=A0A1D1W1F9_RAMVA|nr:hypothetical protein RvY_17249 [Ramazzottius varieornatus]